MIRETRLCSQTSRLIFVRRKLFTSGRNSEWNPDKFQPAQLCGGHCVTSAFEIFPYFDQKTPNWIQGLIFMEGPLAKVTIPSEAHLDTASLVPVTPICLLQIFPPGDENSFSQFFPFGPLGDANVDSQLGASSSHQFVTNPGTALFSREQWLPVQGSKEGGDLAGAQEWGGTCQWKSVFGFMFVGWSWAQGPCCRSRSGECLIFSYFSIIPPI